MYDVPFGVCEILSNEIILEDLSFDDDYDIVFVNFGTDKAVKIFSYFKKIRQERINGFLDIFKSVGVELYLKDVLGVLHIVLLDILLADTNKQVLIVSDTGFTPESILFLQQNFKLLMGNFSNKSILIYDEHLSKATFKIDFKRGLLL